MELKLSTLVLARLVVFVCEAEWEIFWSKSLLRFIMSANVNVGFDLSQLMFYLYAKVFILICRYINHDLL